MKQLTPELIASLNNNQNATTPAVTIYLPTHKRSSPPNMSEDRTRFKNLYQKALEALENRDQRDPFIEEFKQICEQQLENQTFWRQMSESLLVCVRPGQAEFIRLPIDSDEYVAVDNHFHLAPVQALVNDLHDYHLLVVAQKNPLLFHGNAYELVSADVTMPESIEEALKIDEEHLKSVQYHTGNQAGASLYHGHGAGRDNGDEDKLRFYRLIDDLVLSAAQPPLPLILAGVEAEVAAYRQESKHPNILESIIPGNFILNDAPELQQRAWEIVRQEIIEPAHEQAIERYERLKGEAAELVSNRFGSIKSAAENGRVDTLLTNMSRLTTDSVRDNDQSLPKIHFPDDYQSQALDEVARIVREQSGRIINVHDHKMPEKALALAIYRY